MQLSRQQTKFADALAARGMLHYDQIDEILWGDDPNGGPLDPQNIVTVMVYNLRAKGFRIENHFGVGYRLVFDPRQALVEGERWTDVD